MKLTEATMLKLSKVSKSCPNCKHDHLKVVPDVLSLKHDDGLVDMACTRCVKCCYVSMFMLAHLDSLDV